MKARNRAIIDTGEELKETAAIPEVVLPIPAYVDDPTLNSSQRITDLVDTVVWFHYCVPDLIAQQRGYAQALYVACKLAF